MPRGGCHSAACSANNKLVAEEAQLGQLQRQIRSLAIDAEDKFAYAGTTSGDVLQVSAVNGSQAAGGSLKKHHCFSTVIYSTVIYVGRKATHSP